MAEGEDEEVNIDSTPGMTCAFFGALKSLHWTKMWKLSFSVRLSLAPSTFTNNTFLPCFRYSGLVVPAPPMLQPRSFFLLIEIRRPPSSSPIFSSCSKPILVFYYGPQLYTLFFALPASLLNCSCFPLFFFCTADLPHFLTLWAGHYTR